MDEKRKQRTIAYIKKNIRQFTFKLNKLFPEDQEMIAWLEAQPNKNDYIRTLIEADMEKHDRT